MDDIASQAPRFERLLALSFWLYSPLWASQVPCFEQLLADCKPDGRDGRASQVPRFEQLLAGSREMRACIRAS